MLCTEFPEVLTSKSTSVLSQCKVLFTFHESRQHLRRERTVDVFFVVVRVHESRSTSSEGDPQLGKFVLSRQVNLNTPGLSQALPAICLMSVLSVCEPSIEGKISKILTEFYIS